VTRDNIVSRRQSPARQALDFGLRAWGSMVARRYDITRTIVIACAGRSGATWLAEILGTLPGYPVIWEPLHLGTNPTSRRYGFDWNTYIPIGASVPGKREYLEDVLTGRALCLELLTRRQFALSQFLWFRGFVVKLTLGNLLLPWMVREFPVRAVLMIRHPCAVVASQMKHQGWDVVGPDNLTVPDGVLRDFPRLQGCLAMVSSREEALAFDWAMQTLIPLSAPEPHAWHFLTYEGLIANGAGEVERLFASLQEEAPAAAFARLKTPSATASRNRDPLNDWRSALRPNQVQAILRVTREAGLDFYGESALIDQRKLREFREGCARTVRDGV